MSHELNEQHHLLHRLIDALRSAITAGGDRAVMSDYMERMLSYMMLHFSTEDRLMIDSSYPDFEAHQKEHEAAMAMTLWLESAYRAGEPNAAVDLLNFVEFWANDHSSDADQRLQEFLEIRKSAAA